MVSKETKRIVAERQESYHEHYTSDEFTTEAEIDFEEAIWTEVRDGEQAQLSRREMASILESIADDIRPDDA